MSERPEMPADIRLADEIAKALTSGMCGCGETQAVLGLLRDVMVALLDGEHDVVREKTDPKEGPFFWMVLYYLDNANLVEHGSNVAHAWLTPLGESALLFLDEHGCDETTWPRVAFDTVNRVWVLDAWAAAVDGSGKA